MAKIHLVQTPIPLTEGRDQDAMCGRTIKNAVFEQILDTESVIPMAEWSAISICAKCSGTDSEERYIYAVREGEESRASKITN